MVPKDECPLPIEPNLAGALAERGFVDGRGPGVRAKSLVAGGFEGFRLDDPPRPRLYANGQGGFRVHCPVDGGNVVPAFQAALTHWRAGGARSLSCPSCGSSHDLGELDFRPRAVFGRGAIVLLDVAYHALTDEGVHEMEALIGPFHVIGSRR